MEKPLPLGLLQSTQQGTYLQEAGHQGWDPDLRVESAAVAS